MKNKKLKLGLSIICIASMSLCVSSFLIIKNNIFNKEDLCLQSEVISQQKIKITSIKYSSTNYGSQKVNFSVNPKVNTDEVDYSIKYIDDSSIEDGIFSISFKPLDGYIEISCLRPFIKQVLLTIYAKSNDKINASITLDFKEKITLNPSIEVNENSPLSVNGNISSTGGSITIDKTIKSESISYSSSFVSLIKTMLKETFENIHYSNPQTTYYNETSAKYVGLEQSDCDLLFSNNFSYGSFLESIYYEVEYSWIESDSDYESYEHIYFNIADLNKEDVFSLFDGTTSVFTYSCVVNNQTYTKELGLLIEAINIDNVTLNKTHIVF